jgi:hypothetical protein
MNGVIVLHIYLHKYLQNVTLIWCLEPIQERSGPESYLERVSSELLQEKADLEPHQQRVNSKPL